MRNQAVAILASLILIFAACKPKETLVGFDARNVPVAPTGKTAVLVNMRIIGMAILNTNTDDAKFTLLIPEVMGHQPFIYAKRTYKMVADGTATRIPVEENTASDAYDVVILNDEDLSLEPASADALKYTIGSGSCPILESDMEHLRWAPSLSDALRKPAKVDKKYTDTPPEKAGLHARMNIEHGYVYSQPENLYLWQFRSTFSGKSGHKQLLTTQVFQKFWVLLPNADFYLHVKSQPFGGAVGDFVKLSPDANNEIHFTIGNTKPGNKLPGSGTFSDEDTHFPEYYKILDPSIFDTDKQGKPVYSRIRGFKLRQEYCRQPTDSLVNCGPGRP